LPKSIFSSHETVEPVSRYIRTHPIDKDYHVLIVVDNFTGNNNIKFECYNSPHTEIEFEELKEKILQVINA
jgi:hypothetical protein